MKTTPLNAGGGDLLVIGYGNTLRRDDGVGPRVAETVGSLRLPHVHTLICQQLSPEHADPISQAHTVIFVDAAVDEPHEVQFRKLEPGATSQLMAHAADPRTMLALARDVFGHAPEAWWLTIPAMNLDFSEELSPETEAGYHEAVSPHQIPSGTILPVLRQKLSSSRQQSLSGWDGLELGLIQQLKPFRFRNQLELCTKSIWSAPFWIR